MDEESKERPLFPSLEAQRKNNVRQPARGNSFFGQVSGRDPVIRPAADFMTDSMLLKEVFCDRCDEKIIEAFKDHHVCDEAKLKSMVSNNKGDLAEDLS